MAVTFDRGVELDRCAPCGIWFFDRGELEAWEGGQRLAYRVSALSVMPQAKPGPDCPRCGGSMREVASAELAADVCTRCHGVMLRRLSPGHAMPVGQTVPTPGTPPLELPDGSASLRQPPPPPPKRRRGGIDGEDVGDVALAGAFVAGGLVDASDGLELAADGADAIGEGVGQLGEAGGELAMGLLEGIGEFIGELLGGLGDAL